MMFMLLDIKKSCNCEKLSVCIVYSIIVIIIRRLLY